MTEREMEYFPDGTPIDDWFYETRIPALSELGRPYVLTEHGIRNDGRLYTQEIQRLIDRAHENGGGVIVVPQGTFRTGSLFFRQGVNLYVEEGGVLMGSDDVSDYSLRLTRIEGETCLYFAALINAAAWTALPCAGREPSTETACVPGRHSGCAGNGILIAPTRMSRGRGLCTCPAAGM